MLFLLFAPLLVRAAPPVRPSSQYVVVTVPGSTAWLSLTDYPSGLPAGAYILGLTNVPTDERGDLDVATACNSSYIPQSAWDVGFTYNPDPDCTSIRLTNNSESSIDFAIVGPNPTATVPVPTNTPTITPSPTEEVIFATETPTPIPTPDVPALTQQSRDLAYNAFILQVFGVTAVLGVLALIFVRIKV